MWRDRGDEGMQNVCCVPVTLRLASVTDKLSWLTRNLKFLWDTLIGLSSFQKVSIPEASVAPGSLLDLQILGFPPRMPGSEFGAGLHNSLCCNKPPGGGDWNTLKLSTTFISCSCNCLLKIFSRWPSRVQDSDSVGSFSTCLCTCTALPHRSD